MYSLVNVLFEEVNEKVVQVDKDTFDTLLSIWCSQGEKKVVKELGYYAQIGKSLWIAGDNSDGDFFVEEFDTEVKAIAWLTTGLLDYDNQIGIFYDRLADVAIDFDTYDFKDKYPDKESFIKAEMNKPFHEAACELITYLFQSEDSYEYISRVITLLSDYAFLKEELIMHF